MSFDQLGLRRLGNRADIAATAAVTVPVLGILGSEAVLYAGYTGYALWGHLLTLLTTSLLPLRFGSDTRLYQALLLVPLFRLVNLGMPVFFNLTIYWFPLIYGPLIPGLYFIKRAQHGITPHRDYPTFLLLLPGGLILTLLLVELQARLTPAAALTVFWFLLIYGTLLVGIYPGRRSDDTDHTVPRLPRVVPLLPSILLLALFLAEIEFRVLNPVALIPQWSAGNLLVISVVMFGFVGLVEELLFRGILQPTLESRFGVVPGLLLSSGLFGALHSGYGLPGELVFAGVIGLLLGVIYDVTDSIVLVTLIHGALNVFLFAVLPFHTSILLP